MTSIPFYLTFTSKLIKCCTVSEFSSSKLQSYSVPTQNIFCQKDEVSNLSQSKNVKCNFKLLNLFKLIFRTRSLKNKLFNRCDTTVPDLKERKILSKHSHGRIYNLAHEIITTRTVKVCRHTRIILMRSPTLPADFEARSSGLSA